MKAFGNSRLDLSQHDEKQLKKAIEEINEQESKKQNNTLVSDITRNLDKNNTNSNIIKELEKRKLIRKNGEVVVNTYFSSCLQRAFESPS